MIKSYKISFSGQVQGVGFRPYVYNLATEFNLKGTVSNNEDGVLIFALGDPQNITAFYKKLIDKGLATRISMWDYPLRDNGLFITYVFLTPGTKHEDVEKIILNEYELIKKNGVTAEEIARAKGQIRTQLAFSRDGSYSIEYVLNEAIAIGDWTK